MLVLQLDGYQVPIKRPESFWQKLKSDFSTSPKHQDHALLFDLRQNSEYSWHFHRLFSLFSTRIHWLDMQFRVIKVNMSRPLRLYRPADKVYFILETHPDISFEVGQQVPILPEKD